MSRNWTKLDSPMERDNKSMPLSEGGISVFLKAVVSVFGILPATIALLPVTATYQIAKRIFAPNSGLIQSPPATTMEEYESIRKSIAADHKRTYDVVLYGATGFTGGIAARYLAKHYGTGDVKWAIAGRRRDALNTLASELRGLGATEFGIVIADSSDEESLRQMVASTRVVVTTAGPFSKYGSSLVKYCAALGTHYSDITGEVDWVREMVDRYDDWCRKSGAKIVNFCGHDCVPWDLAVLMLSKALSQRNETLKSVVIGDRIRADFSGGTLNTVFHIMNTKKTYKQKLSFDPFLKDKNGNMSTAKVSNKNEMLMSYSSDLQSWVGFFAMSGVMANCVKRSNVLLNYSDQFSYRECLEFPSFLAAIISTIGMWFLGVALASPFAGLGLRLGLLPKPGQGPSEADRKRGFLQLTFIGRGHQGGVARGMLYFPLDPGYQETARMVVEAGLCLADIAMSGEPGEPGEPGGVHTPASAMGEAYLSRLIRTGCQYSIKLED